MAEAIQGTNENQVVMIRLNTFCMIGLAVKLHLMEMRESWSRNTMSLLSNYRFPFPLNDPERKSESTTIPVQCSALIPLPHTSLTFPYLPPINPS